MGFFGQTLSWNHLRLDDKKNEEKRPKENINTSELIEKRIKKREQKYISVNKLMKVSMKRGKIQPIIIVIDIFPFFSLQKF